MSALQDWMKAHKFESHLAAFLLIIFPSAALYPAAQSGNPVLIWALLGLVALGNLLAILTR